LGIVIASFLTVPAFADVTIQIPKGTAVPGCEETDECFNPWLVTIEVGETVTWVNSDTGAHTVVSGNPTYGPDGVFDSSLFLPGKEFSHTFDTSGLFAYYDVIHPWMQGIVRVIEGDSNEEKKITINLALAKSPNSIKQKISNSLSQDGCCVLADKETVTVKGILKTSYKVEHLLLEETVGVVNMWSDVDGKNVHEIELSTSHFNDGNSEVVAWVLLNVLKKGISDGQIDDNIFFDMADEVDKHGKSSILTKNGYKVVLTEKTVVEGTPGLTFLILNIDYNLDTFISEKPQIPIEQSAEQREQEQVQEDVSSDGGCLIATATFGSELAPQVQQLRELRDNYLLTTGSGSAFMTGFNELYYSFSPIIADLERQSSIFKEAVKLTITPLITSLSLLNYVDMDSEVEVLGYGISLILLNVGMYFVAPAILIHSIRCKVI